MPGPALAHNISEYTPTEAEEYVNITFIQNYVLYATSTLLVWELLVTFDEEVERVWSLQWRLPKLLFMLNRYIARGLLFSFSCQIYAYWQAIPPRLAILAAQAVMVIRLWAICAVQTMLQLLLFLFALEVTAVVTCMTLATMDTQGSSEPHPLSCELDALSPMIQQYASGTWIAPVCFELIILIITLVKIFPPLPFRFFKRVRSMKVATRERNPTLNLLARDSIIYFAFIFTFTLANAIIYELDFSAYYHSLLLGPTSAISCIAVSRMIINIRSLPAPDFKGAASVNMVGSAVVFADNSQNEDASPTSDAQGTGTRGRFCERTEGREPDADVFEMMSRLESREVLAEGVDRH
ncbi:hypothetical protein B0H11DRAFT_2108443 [Mycena galericulata]|nr:hypothetical protein B0H11DRAFT_2108443 [Mycena galericulata]